MKKIIVLAVICLVIMGISFALASETKIIENHTIKIVYEGKKMAFYDAKGARVYPISYNGSTYLPIRALSALFDQKIKWDANNGAIYLGEGEISTGSAKEISNDEVEITLAHRELDNAIINKQIKVYNNGKFQLFFDANDESVFPISYNGTTYLPVRALSNMFSKNISWDGNKNEVTIAKYSSYDSYDGNLKYSLSTNSSGLALDSAQSVSTMPAMASESTIGLSVGGAKDANNFRENIKNNYFPISTDITYNGLFYDYMFDITSNNGTKSDELFSPSYSTAVSKDPISNNNEYYMTVGLNSNIKESDFARKKLNLVVVLDISGSMSSYLDEYYYDNPYSSLMNKSDAKTNMRAATESINALLDHLNKDDKFGLVLFETSAEVQKELTQVSEINMEKYKEEVLKIGPKGGTNFEAGYRYGTTLFNYIDDIDPNEYENRIIVITDAMPNTGITNPKSMMGMVNANSKKGIYTTIIGVGVDFNTKLIEEITDVKGANYYSVHDSKTFEKRMGDEFDYMVTPLVFDLSLDVDSKDFDIETVYGSDTSDSNTGNIMKVNTLFPSKSEGGEVKGGIVLLKLKRKNNNNSANLNVKVSYKDREGKEHNNSQKVTFKSLDTEYYENTGIRKGILLTRYVNAMKNWILYERTEHKPRFLIVPQYGIVDCIIREPEVVTLLGEHERTSVKLSVSNEYKEIFKNLKAYIEKENKILKDDTLLQEIDIINILLEK